MKNEQAENVKSKKKGNKKIFIFLLLAVVIIVAVISIIPKGENVDIDANGIKYALSNDGNSYSVVGIKEDNANDSIVIPSEYNSKPVTAIAGSAFYLREELKSITIPESIVTIGANAFSDCRSLTEIKYNATECSKLGSGYNTFNYCGQNGAGIKVIIGANVKIIPDYLFYSRYSDSASKITEVVFSEGSACESMGYSAFENCSSLKTINIPNGIVKIDGNAFKDCRMLENVDIPSSVNDIGASAFDGCSSIVSVTIPDNVSSIKEDTFADCSGLVDLVIGNGVEAIGSGAFSGCSALKNISIGSKLSSLSVGSAFFRCSNIETINVASENTKYYVDNNCLIETATKKLVFGSKNSVIPTDGSVTAIGHSAFRYRGVKMMNIPNCITTIGSYAFEYCSELIEIHIPDSVTTISSGAFRGCKKLTNITIPKNVASIENDSFNECSNLSRINVDRENLRYHSDGNCLIETDKKTLILGCKDSVIPADGSVTAIGNNAFYGCHNLTNITIPYKVTTIGFNAFSNCYKLRSIVIPENVGSVNMDAFSNCYNLVEVINKSKLYIGKGSYSVTCGRLGEYAIVVHEEESKIVDKNGFLFITDEDANKNYLIGYDGNNSHLTLPEDYNGETYEIYTYAFEYLDNLKSVDIPKNAVVIGSSSFRGCTQLTDVNIEVGVEIIGNYVFANCDNLKSITLPNTIELIVYDAFQSSNITEIKFNGTVAEWNAVEKNNGWNNGLKATKVICTDGEVEL